MIDTEAFQMDDTRQRTDGDRTLLLAPGKAGVGPSFLDAPAGRPRRQQTASARSRP
jgi:hypothetical protein